MTEKRYFIIDVEETHQENAVLQYNDKLDDYDFVCFEDDSDKLVMKLNELAEENKELKEENEYLKQFLKQSYDELKYFTGLFEDNEIDVTVKELLRNLDLILDNNNMSLPSFFNYLVNENEQLEQELKTKCIVNKQYEENQRLIKMLDNVANYMQKQHKDIPIDDFVEWWNNIATEGIINE